MSNTTEFADKLKTAMHEGNFYTKSYVWKGRKERDADGNLKQEVINLIDADEAQLRGFYNHCISMLYNQDRQNPGRRPLLDIMQAQRDRCGVELFLRESEAEGVLRYTIIESIKKAMLLNGISSEQERDLVLSDFIVVNQLYANLPIKLVREGCLQRLGKFDKSHITLTFILKQGLKITSEDEQELTEFAYDNKGNTVKRNYLSVVRERLNIADHMPLKIDPKGLTYSQLRDMLNLKSRYYNELTTGQLRTLRYRILLSLEDEIMFHIEQWEQRMAQIKEVATLKGITL